MQLKYFKPAEFDCPDMPGSGAKMQPAFLTLLDKARDIAGIIFRITSGYRTQSYAKKLRAKGYEVARSSSHFTGWAADIACTDAQLPIMLKALYAAGFRRFGIMKDAIHVDNDPSKPAAVWKYKNTEFDEWAKYGSLELISKL
jgi:hypothetical protein